MTETQRIDAILDTLLRMRETLSNPAKWCGDGGLGDNGSRCLMLTMNFVLRHRMDRIKIFRTIRDGLFVPLTGAPNIATWNDTHSHADVLRLLDTAIAARTAELTETTA